MDDEIKLNLMPCPFCGHYAFFCRNTKEFTFTVMCSSCHIETSPQSTPEMAATKWNTRVKIYNSKDKGEIDVFYAKDPYNKDRLSPTEKHKTTRPFDPRKVRTANPVSNSDSFLCQPARTRRKSK